jgi:hypothetical protein
MDVPPCLQNMNINCKLKQLNNFIWIKVLPVFKKKLEPIPKEIFKTKYARNFICIQEDCISSYPPK